MGRFSAGYNWIFGLVAFFGLMIVQLIVVPALKKKLAPELLTIDPSFTGQYDFIFSAWDWIFYILLFGIIVFMVASIFLQEREEVY